MRAEIDGSDLSRAQSQHRDGYFMYLYLFVLANSPTVVFLNLTSVKSVKPDTRSIRKALPKVRLLKWEGTY